MSESVLGRKRTADGVLVEVRAVGPAGVGADELTETVRLLLATADMVCRELRARRVALYRVATDVENERPARVRELGGLALPPQCDDPECPDADCHGGEHCSLVRARCTHVRCEHAWPEYPSPPVLVPVGPCPDCGRVFPRVAS